MKKENAKKLLTVCIAAIILTACDLNASITDDLNFYTGLTPAASWEELKREVEEGEGKLIAVTRGFSQPAGSAAIQVRREVTMSRGGGVYNWGSEVTIKGGIISGNTAQEGGEAAFEYSPENIDFGEKKLTMTGGTIGSNTASNGGGVFVFDTASFAKSGGTIFGNDAEEKDKNTASGNENGHAVVVRNVYVMVIKYRDTTAGPDVVLDSSLDSPEWNK